jgi:hypothetical protein
MGASTAPVLPYNPLWHEKGSRIGGQSDLGSVPVMRAWMKGAHVSACESILTRAGIAVS